ncbi:unnamed protein product [Ectocarpus fasciculatus]
MTNDSSVSKTHTLPPLPYRLGVESVAGVLSAFSVAPAISIVDKAIVSNASGLEPLLPCMINGVKSMFSNPGAFLRQPSFLFIWGVYSGTYIVANSTEAICEYNNKSPFYPKFLTSSCANVTLSVLKDKAFARMFGVGAAKPLPARSYGLFATRDSMTILASFSLPGPLSLMMQERCACTPLFADNVAQLFTPVTMQIFSAPLHLHGLDLYNRTGALSVSDRIDFIKQEYVKTTLARMARIFPAFGIGGVLNKFLRQQGISCLEGRGTAVAH